MVERKEKIIKGKNGVVFAIIQNGKILLEERTNSSKNFYGFTIIPGGVIEKGESIYEALEREIKEKCDCLPKMSYYLSLHCQQEGRVINDRYLFLVTEVEESIRNREPEKSRHIWVSLNEARNICKHPFTLEFLDVLENYLTGENK